MFETLKRADLPHLHSGILRSPSSTRPTIWSIQEDGVKAVVKDFSANKFLFRHTVGRFLIWRESRAYARLHGVRGIPIFFGVLDGLALVVEEVPGRGTEKLGKKTRLPPRFFDAFENLVDCVHHRGLVHCDLKRASNVILGDDGLPYIVDWAASVSEKEFRFPLLRRIYRRFLLDDRMAIIKLKLRHNPEMLRPEEKALYRHRGLGEKTIRAVRNRLRELLQKIA